MSDKQHSIDLMPPSIRARSQAGLRMGQFTVFAVVSLTVVIAIATHSKIALSSAQDRLFETAGQAEQVFATEARAAELKHELDAIQSYNRLYERLALPLNIGDVIATVVQSLPSSVTLDQLDLDAGARMLGHSARSRGVEKPGEAPPRVLTGELSGFALNDQHIAELVTALESTPPFEQVSIDFSRGRRVNERDAREFRLSFRINLENTYNVMSAEDTGDASRERQEVADADR
jgi:hypothetical protein